MRLTESQLKNLVARLVAEADSADDEDDIKIKTGPTAEEIEATRSLVKKRLVPEAKIEIFDARGDALADEPSEEDPEAPILTAEVTKEGDRVKTQILKEKIVPFKLYTASIGDQPGSVLTELIEIINPPVVGALLAASSDSCEKLGIKEGDNASLEKALKSISKNEKIQEYEKYTSDLNYDTMVRRFIMIEGAVRYIFFSFDFEFSPTLKSAAYGPAKESTIEIVFINPNKVVPSRGPGAVEGGKVVRYENQSDILDYTFRYGEVYGQNSSDEKRKLPPAPPWMSVEDAISRSLDIINLAVFVYEPLNRVIEKLPALITSGLYIVKINGKILRTSGM